VDDRIGENAFAVTGETMSKGFRPKREISFPDNWEKVACASRHHRKKREKSRWAGIATSRLREERTSGRLRLYRDREKGEVG